MVDKAELPPSRPRAARPHAPLNQRTMHQRRPLLPTLGLIAHASASESSRDSLDEAFGGRDKSPLPSSPRPWWHRLIVGVSRAAQKLWFRLKSMMGMGNPSEDASVKEIEVVMCVALIDQSRSTGAMALQAGNALAALCQEDLKDDAFRVALSDVQMWLPQLQTYAQGAGPIVYNKVEGRSVWQAVAYSLDTFFGDLSSPVKRKRLSRMLVLSFHPDKRPELRGREFMNPGDWTVEDWDAVWDFIKICRAALASPNWP